MKISSVSEMRELDKRAITEFGIKEEILMENAGHAVYLVILNEFGVRGKKFTVICGIGNNGGDGLVVARKIHSTGGMVKVFILGETEKFRGAAGMNWDIISRLPVEKVKVQSIKNIRNDLFHSDAVIDAIFGTGLAREVEGLYAEVIALANSTGKTIFSVDIPSGVNGDTGKIMGTSICADYTITFGLPKIGTILFPGYDHCGKLYVTHISFPPALYSEESIKVEVNNPTALPPRNRTGHKGYFGKALFISGAAGYLGAPYFSALSFLKAGGGYSHLAAPRSITTLITSRGNEIVSIPQKETKSGSISLENSKSLIQLSEKMDIVVLGPGLSLEEETQQLVKKLTRDIDKPLIIDGDGITALSGNLEIIRKRNAPTVLTPHLGEMSRITGVSVDQIDEEKIKILQRTVFDLKSYIVLKGAHSLIGFPNESVFINMSGNSGMATAGSGDVLTGAIAAMYGLGLPFQDAVKKGVFIHGLSGDLAARSKGEDGITAQDIMDNLPKALKLDREGLPHDLNNHYRGMQVI